MSGDRHSKIVFDLIRNSANGVKIHSAKPVIVDAPKYAGADDGCSNESHFRSG
jgi:hypothetical protein